MFVYNILHVVVTTQWLCVELQVCLFTAVINELKLRDQNKLCLNKDNFDLIRTCWSSSCFSLL